MAHSSGGISEVLPHLRPAVEVGRLSDSKVLLVGDLPINIHMSQVPTAGEKKMLQRHSEFLRKEHPYNFRE